MGARDGKRGDDSLVSEVRQLVVVLGDQLDADSAAFDGFESQRDRIFLAEVSAESEHVWSHKARIALFLTAMRHFRHELRARGDCVEYVELAESTLGAELARAVEALRPERVVVVEPGEWRVREELRRAVPGLEIRPDRHFLCSADAFRAWAGCFSGSTPSRSTAGTSRSTWTRSSGSRPQTSSACRSTPTAGSWPRNRTSPAAATSSACRTTAARAASIPRSGTAPGRRFGLGPKCYGRSRTESRGASRLPLRPAGDGRRTNRRRGSPTPRWPSAPRGARERSCRSAGTDRGPASRRTAEWCPG